MLKDYNMQERKLNFNRNEDPTIVDDSDGQISKKLSKIYSDLALNLGFCQEQLVAGKLTKGMMENHLFLSEHYVMDFLTALGYDGILKKKNEERNSEIRSLNEQNRELRKQLGQKVSNEDFRERCKNMSHLIREWWNIYGFGHTSEIQFMEYGFAKIKFSGMISDAYYDKSNNNTKKDKIVYLKGIGFDFDKDSENVLITDENIKTLTNLIVCKYPSANIDQMTTYHRSASGRTYGDIEVCIRNLDDIK